MKIKLYEWGYGGDGSNPTHCSDLIGLGTVFQQQRHNVGVSLLGCLMQRSVTELWEKENTQTENSLQQLLKLFEFCDIFKDQGNYSWQKVNV